MSQLTKPTASRPLALSASRIADFQQCPLLYRFRALDRLAEPTTVAQLKGTVVHAALENLFELPHTERLPEVATASLPELLDKLDHHEGSPVVEEEQRREFLNECAGLVYNYYRVEDPRSFTPAGREQYVETVVGDGVPVRGYMDRVDIAPSGEVRIVDYKTGKKPLPRYSGAVHQQMELYSLMYRATAGVLPDQLKVIYLKTSDAVITTPTHSQLDQCEAEVTQVWRTVTECGETGNFPSRTTKLCGWCSFQQYCPEFGGTAPDYPGWPG